MAVKSQRNPLLGNPGELTKNFSVKRSVPRPGIYEILFSALFWMTFPENILFNGPKLTIG